MFPNVGQMVVALFQSLLRLMRPRSLQESAMNHAPPSLRYAGFYNQTMQVGGAGREAAARARARAHVHAPI